MQQGAWRGRCTKPARGEASGEGLVAWVSNSGCMRDDVNSAANLARVIGRGVGTASVPAVVAEVTLGARRDEHATF